MLTDEFKYLRECLGRRERMESGDVSICPGDVARLLKSHDAMAERIRFAGYMCVRAEQMVRAQFDLEEGLAGRSHPDDLTVDELRRQLSDQATSVLNGCGDYRRAGATSEGRGS